MYPRKRHISMMLVSLLLLAAMLANMLGSIDPPAWASRDLLGYLLLMLLMLGLALQYYWMFNGSPLTAALVFPELDNSLLEQHSARDFGAANGESCSMGRQPSAPAMDIPASIERMGGLEIWEEIIEAWFEEVPVNLSDLASALETEDQELATRSAHSIKGTSAEILAEELRRISAEAEELCRAGRLGPVVDLLPEMQRSFAETRKRIEEFRAG
ncbi:MAG: Hpt domain-containing protein [bacterium]